jgi:hypothetical protein
MHRIVGMPYLFCDIIFLLTLVANSAAAAVG